jgi:hypothetical protein
MENVNENGHVTEKEIEAWKRKTKDKTTRVFEFDNAGLVRLMVEIARREATEG